MGTQVVATGVGLPPHDHSESWLATLWITLAAAVLVRALVLMNLTELFPVEAMYYSGSDQRSYLEWARQIATGDGLTLDRGPFYFSPLAPYLAGISSALTGIDPLWTAQFWNALAGTAAALLASWIAHRLFHPTAGLLAGLLLALNGAQIAWEHLLLNDPLLPAFLLGALACLLEIQSRIDRGRPTALLSVTAGSLLGLAILARSSNLLPALVLWVVLALGPVGRQPNARRAVLGPMALPILLLTALPVFYNGWFHGLWAITGNGPYNFYIGNSRWATGVFTLWGELIHGQQPAEFWSAQLWRELVVDPTLLIDNLAWKTQLLVNAWVAPDNWNYYFSRHLIPALNHFTLDPLAFHLLGLTGFVLVWPERKRLALFNALLLGFALSLILVFVSGRFKLPLHGMLAILGAGGLIRFGQAWRQKNHTKIFIGLLSMLIALPLSLPRPALSQAVPALFPLRTNDYYNFAMTLHQQGHDQHVVALLEPFLENTPFFPSNSAVLLANILIGQKRPQPAARLMERALEDTNAPVAARRLWMEIRLQALADFADEQTMRQAIRELLVVVPDHPLGHLLAPEAPPRNHQEPSAIKP